MKRAWRLETGDQPPVGERESAAALEFADSAFSRPFPDLLGIVGVGAED